MNLAIGIIILSLVVFAHELGHYAVMRWLGVPVKNLVIGFGPYLFKKQLANGTVLHVKIPLLVGYNRYVKEGPGCLPSQPPGRRIAVYLAGVAANLAVAVVTLTAAYGLAGFFPFEYADYVSRFSGALQTFAAAIVGSLGLLVAMPYLIVTNLVAHPTDGLIRLAAELGTQAMAIKNYFAFMGDASASAKWISLLAIVGTMNAAGAGAQLLPLYPLDGGQAVDALLQKIGVTGATLTWWRRIGIALVVSFFALSLVTVATVIIRLRF